MTEGSASANEEDDQYQLRQTVIGSACIAMGTLLFSIINNNAIYKLSGMKESQLLFGRCSTQLLIAAFYSIVILLLYYSGF